MRSLAECVAAVREAPRDKEARRRLSAAAAERGAWDELAALLDEELRVADRREVTAALLEELADVHENYLDQPLEAIGALERLVELTPGVVALHDRLAGLYGRAGAWLKAAERLEHVGALAPDDRARTALRTALSLYRRHGRPERAIAAARAILGRRPGDAEALRALDELYEEVGEWRELARVRALRAARADEPSERAAILRAQARALERIGDIDAAATAAGEASRLAPEELSSLIDHAAVLARGGRGREAAALLGARVAEALARGASAAELAALRLRHAAMLEDACGDRAASAAVLEQLLAASPGYVPALERLVHQATGGDPRAHAAALLRLAAAMPDGGDKAATLHDAAGRLRDARDFAAEARTLEEVCALAPGADDARRELDDARAAVLVERAAAEARAGDAASAEKRLAAVLSTRRHDVGANLALARLRVDQRRHAAAAEHLRAVIADAPDELPPEQVGELVFCYAGVVAALGDADEAHRLYHDAHRLRRRDLRITLALGESCFARRLWREAALHLGSLAAHPDAPRHAAEVAAGLVHAAEAEARAQRTTVATRRYEEAVALDPGCAPAWHALAEAASERGDLARAAECLEHEADATREPRDRVRLFDALGDLAERVLGDRERAARCWARAVEAEPSAPILAKLLAAYEAAGDVGRARPVADRLVALAPLDEDVVWRASALAVAAGDHDATASLLERALAAWDAAGARGEGDPRRAELWRRLGEARLARRDARARAAFERAVAIAPESDGAAAARRALVDVAPPFSPSSTLHLRALVEAEQRPSDALALARALAHAARGGAGAATAEDAHAMYGLAAALGAAFDDDDEAYLANTPAKIMASDEAYPGALSAAELRALVDDEDDAPLRDVLDRLSEAAPLVCPDAPSALAAAGLAGAERVSPMSHAAAAALFPQIARALGGSTMLLYATTARGAPDLTLLAASPPVVVLGPRLSSRRAQSHHDADVLVDAELRFRLGRVVELARPGRVFAAGTAPASFARLVATLRRAFGDGVDPSVAAEAERLRGALSVRLRAQIGEALAGVAAEMLDPARYRAACERAADRAGLLASGHVAVAVQVAGGPVAARHLVRLAATPRYLEARRKLRGID